MFLLGGIFVSSLLTSHFLSLLCYHNFAFTLHVISYWEESLFRHCWHHISCPFSATITLLLHYTWYPGRGAVGGARRPEADDAIEPIRVDTPIPLRPGASALAAPATALPYDSQPRLATDRAFRGSSTSRGLGWALFAFSVFSHGSGDWRSGGSMAAAAAHENLAMGTSLLLS